MKLLRFLLTIIITLVLLGSSTSPVFAASLIVTKIADTNDGICDSDCSLREAISTASMGSTINFDNTLSGEMLVLVSTLTLSKNVTIDGSTLASPITVSGDSNNDGIGDIRMFTVNPGINVTLDSILMTKPSISFGGSIYNDNGILIVKNCLFSHNGKSNQGRAISNYHGTLTVINTTFSENEGQSIVNIGSQSELIVNNSAFNNNLSVGILNDGDATVIDSIFSNNMTHVSGVIDNGGSMSISNTIITGNSSFDAGGINNSSIMNVINSTISNNSARYNGGGIYNDGPGVLTLTNSIISGNFTTHPSGSSGGGIFNLGTLTIANSTISNNLTAYSGGGILSSGTLIVTSSTINGNASYHNGGGVYLDNDATMTMINSTVSDNSSSDSGGGIFNSSYGSTMTIINSTISGNTASNVGGLYNEYPGTLNYANTIIANSTNGDCSNNGIINTNINNLIEDGSCSALLSGDPNLATLSNNGGPTQTMALLPSSPAINTGDKTTCAASPINNLDQRGISRPEGGACEIGAYEVDIPIIVSMQRLDINPNLSPTVDFSVTFSESVIGVDVGDFNLTTNGLSDPAIIGVGGSGAIYTITVNTGNGDGTIRLDVPLSASITDLAANSLDKLPFISGPAYTIVKPPAPSAPVLRSPRNSIVTNHLMPTLWWTSVKGGVTCEVEVAEDSDFTSIVDTHIASGLSHTVTSSLLDGKYYWRVRAYNASNQAGAWSAVRSFTIDTSGPSAPQLSFPLDAASSNRTPAFKWLKVSGAVLYEFQYDNDSDLLSPTYAVTTRGTSRRPPAMNPGTYYWHVRAKDALGNWGDWSTPFIINITSP